MFSLFLRLPKIKDLDPNGHYKYKHESDKNKKWLSVISAIGLFASTDRRISFKILLMCPDFQFSRLFVWAGRQHCPICLKKYHKNERNL